MNCANRNRRIILDIGFLSTSLLCLTCPRRLICSRMAVISWTLVPQVPSSILMKRQKIIPNYQFDFRRKHATIEQINNKTNNRIIKKISKDMDANRYLRLSFSMSHKYSIRYGMQDCFIKSKATCHLIYMQS